MKFNKKGSALALGVVGLVAVLGLSLVFLGQNNVGGAVAYQAPSNYLTGAQAAAICGDGICEAGESCATDCGSSFSSNGVTLSTNVPAEGELAGDAQALMFVGGSAESGTVTVSGLAPNTEYYVGGVAPGMHTTDASGTLSFSGPLVGIVDILRGS